MQVTAILLAAGKGLRFKTKTSKPLVRIDSRPIIIYSLLTFSNHPLVKDIIVVVSSQNSKDIIKQIAKFRIKKIRKIVYGGLRRQDSVYNGLRALEERAEMVLIHDVARPFIDRRIVTSVINEAKKTNAAIVGVPVKATIKEALSCQLSAFSKNIVKRTIDRKNLWEIQTPQVFKRRLIMKAYKKFGSLDVTDDAILVEKLGERVTIVLGSYENIKITTPEDLIIAEATAKRHAIQNRNRLRYTPPG